LKIFDKVSPYITEKLGVIGLNSYDKMSGLINISRFNGGPVSHFFRIFFVYKRHWINIPENIKLYFGDDFIFNNSIINKKDIYVIENLFCLIESGITTNTLNNRSEIFEEDKNIYRQILLSQGVNPKTFSPVHYGND
jgi:hypothetical protein